jgi:hypothetical protein
MGCVFCFSVSSFLCLEDQKESLAAGYHSVIAFIADKYGTGVYNKWGQLYVF